MGGEERVTHYLSWAIIITVLIVSYLIIKDFLIAIASAFILAYLLKPIYDRLEKKIGKKAAAIISISTVLIITLIAIGFIVSSLVTEISLFLSGNTVQIVFEKIKNLPYKEVLANNLSEIMKELGKYTINIIKSSVVTIPERILSIFIMFFTAYYILIDWDNLRKKFTELLPFKQRAQVVSQMEMVIKDILEGTFLLAILESLIAIIGFWLLGVKFAILLSFLIGIFAFIPALGPLLVWVPVAIIEFANGNIGTSIGVVILGVILSSYVDSIVRIKLVGKKSKIHPVVMLVGLFGGITLFGPVGFILGPLVLSILLTIVKNTPKLKI